MKKARQKVRSFLSFLSNPLKITEEERKEAYAELNATLSSVCNPLKITDEERRECHSDIGKLILNPKIDKAFEFTFACLFGVCLFVGVFEVYREHYYSGAFVFLGIITSVCHHENRNKKNC